MLQRLMHVKWKPYQKRWKSHKVLLLEYFRQSVLWAKALSAMADWPIMDFAAHIDPMLRADSSIMDVWHHHLLITNPTNKVPDEMESLLEAALHWAAAEDSHLTAPYNLPPPYEPIILMYERGGYFYRTQNTVEITSVTAIVRRGWQYYDKSDPDVSIDSASLDQIDLETS
jgi:hypothetical protein